MPFSISSPSVTENKRDGSALKAPNCGPVHRPYQQRTDISKLQEKFSSAPAATQDAKKPAGNGVLMQMERDKEAEEEEEEEKSHSRMRIETAELVNGDVDGADQVDDHSPSQRMDRTGAESHAEDEDGEKTSETEQKTEEWNSEQKVRSSLLLVCSFLRTNHQ